MTYLSRVMILSSLVLTLVGCGDGEVFKDGQGTGGNNDNDPPAQTTPPVVTALPVSVQELSPNNVVAAVITVSLSSAATQSVSLSYATQNGTALAAEHYRSTAGELEFSVGQTSKEISVPIISNNYYGTDKYFQVNFSQPTGVELGVTSVEVEIVNNDPIPTLGFSRGQLATSEQAGEINLTASLSSPSEYETTFDITLAGTATRDSDYQINNLSFSIPAFATSVALPLTMLTDDIKEGGETIVVSLTNATNAAISETRQALVVMIAGDVVLADTGVKTYYNNGAFDATSAEAGYANQDAEYGRDTGAEANFDDDGLGNLNLSKLDFHGNVLPRNAIEFECVRDNLSGTVYAVWGSTEYVSVWNDPANLYRWYDSNPANNAGNGGTQAPNELELNPEETYWFAPSCAFPNLEEAGLNYDAGCTTENYLTYLNIMGYCGFDDWRLPTINELQSSSLYSQILSYDDNFFPDVMQFSDSPGAASKRLATSTPAADNNASVWCWDVNSARRMLCNKNDYLSIRAARNPATTED